MNKRNTYKVTKVDKARAIVCALWDMDSLPEESNKARWREVKQWSRASMKELGEQWARAKKVIEERHASGRYRQSSIWSFCSAPADLTPSDAEMQEHYDKGEMNVRPVPPSRAGTK